MHEDITFKLNPAIEAHAISDLRAAVGWDRAEDDYPVALRGYWATVGGFDNMGTLVAWCAVLSDGVRHAVLLDVIVHPAYQRQGIGRRLVTRAVEHIQTQGISIIHVDFLSEHASFYEKCGFSIGLGGIIEG